MRHKFQIGALALAAFFWPLAGLAQQGGTTTLQTVVTILPKKGEAPPIQQSDVHVWANGKESTITAWQPFRGENAGLEFVVLIDESARTILGLQLSELAKFIQSLPPEALAGVAYMQNGRAAFTQELTADHALATKGLRLANGIPGSSASPYFCLSDLAKHWPSHDPKNRRIVLMVTDGVDRYYPRNDPDNPYLQAAIKDSQRADILVYSIYFRNSGRFDNSNYETNAGQNLLTVLGDSTGGKLYLQGLGNPVSFQPFLADLGRRLENQYELGFTASPRPKDEFVQLKVKTDRSHMEVNAPQQVKIGTKD